jgi:hypothetical protein
MRATKQKKIRIYWITECRDIRVTLTAQAGSSRLPEPTPRVDSLGTDCSAQAARFGSKMGPTFGSEADAKSLDFELSPSLGAG